MVHGIDGNFGILSKVESATYTFVWMLLGSSPTSGTNTKSSTYGQPSFPACRHRKECEGGHPEDYRSGEFEEGRRAWKKCACLIHASGTLGGTFNRKQTGKSDWDDARAAAAEWEAAKAWDGRSKESAPDSPPVKDETRITVEDASEAFVASRTNRGIAAPTLAKYKTFIKQLRAYCDSRGYVRLDQLTVADMDRFYASLERRHAGEGKEAGPPEILRQILPQEKVVAENIAEDLQAPPGSSIPANKMPFTDEELDRIYRACDSIGGPKPLGPGYRPWGGEAVKDFVMFSVYTGLRISDVATSILPNG
jgi:integrase